MTAKTCYSGGAAGADRAWGDEAKLHGYAPLHFSFKGHTADVPESELIRLSEEELKHGDPRLKIAGKGLGRHYPPKSFYTMNLLRRNYWQVRNTKAVYAVSGFGEDGRVQGGTSWAVQMFMDLFPPNRDLPLYVFDQAANGWSQRVAGGVWQIIDQPPSPPDVFTGIGSRSLKPNGEVAIKGVFR